VRIQRNSPQIPHKQAQAAAACQGVVANIDVVDNGLGIDVFCSMILNLYLPPIGLSVWRAKVPCSSCHTTGSARWVGFLFQKIAQFRLYKNVSDIVQPTS
jgi:hypothetical protein